MENGVSVGEAGGIFAGLVALLATIGGGLRWAVGWSDRRAQRREAELKVWEESLNRREKEYREQLETRLKTLTASVGAMRLALVEVTAELREHNPNSEALDRAEAALAEHAQADLRIQPRKDLP